MATEPSEQYGNSEWQKEIGWPFQDISWPVPTVINVVPERDEAWCPCVITAHRAVVVLRHTRI